MRLLRSASLLALASLALSAAAQQNLVVNGGFETGDFTGWTVTRAANGSFLQVGPFPRTGRFDAYFGAASSQPDTISQSIATIPGRLYAVNFYVRDTRPGRTDGKGFTASFGDQSRTIVAGQGDYQIYDLFVTATSTNTTLSLSGFNAPGYYDLDDVGVFLNPVPEPATMAALGLGAVAVLRRRKRA